MQGFLGFNITSVKQTADKLKMSVDTLYGSLLLFAQGAKKAGANTQGLQRYINSLGSAIHNLDPQRAKKMAMAIGDIQRVSYDGVEFDVRIPNGREIMAFVRQNVPKIEDKSTSKNNSDSSQETHYGPKELAHEAKEANLSMKQLYGTLLLFAQEAKGAKANVDGLQLGLQQIGKRFKFTAQEAKEAAEKIGQFQIVEYDGVKFQTKAPQTVNVVKQVEKIDKAYRKSGKTANNSRQEFIRQADQIGTSADRAIMAIDSVSGAFGGASTGLSGVVGDVIQLIKNPMTAAIAGAGVALVGIVALGKKMWDEWNESIQEAKQKAEFLQNIAKQNKGNSEKRNDENIGLVDRLKEINGNSNKILNQLQLVQANQIIETLIKNLVKLGYTEDSLRGKLKVEKGKILGIDTAELNTILGATQQQIDKTKAVVDAYAKSATTNFKAARQGLLDANIFTTDTATVDQLNKLRNAEDIRSFRFDAKEDTYVTSGNSISKIKRDPKQVEFEKQWNKAIQNSDYDTVLSLLQGKFKGVKTGDAIKEIQDLYNSIKLLKDEMAELDHLSKVGSKDQASYFSFLSKQTREFEKTLNSANKSKLEQYNKNKKEFEKQKSYQNLDDNEQRYQSDLSESFDLGNKIGQAQKQVDSYNKKIEEAKKKRDGLLAKAQQKTKKGEILNKDEILLIRQANQAYTELLSQRTNAENKVIELKEKQLELDKKIFDAEKQAKQAVDQRIDSAKENIAIRKAEQRGDWKTANTLKIAQQTKQYGAMTKEQRDQIRKAEQAERKFNIKADMRDKVQNMYYDALGGKAGDRQRMYDEYENKKRDKLTKAQRGTIDKIVDLQYALKNTPKLDLSNAQIKTNELTSRGGWKGGAVAPNVDRINQLIASNTQTANSILTQIRQVLSSGLKI